MRRTGRISLYTRFCIHLLDLPSLSANSGWVIYGTNQTRIVQLRQGSNFSL